MNKKKVIILGGGAVGSVLAEAVSLNSNINLKMIGRKEHITRINSHKLEIGGHLKQKFKIMLFVYSSVPRILGSFSSCAFFQSRTPYRLPCS